MINQNLPGMTAQFRQVMLDQALVTELIDVVHLKLGNAAFEKLIELDLQEMDEFFFKYMRFTFVSYVPLVNQLRRILYVLKNQPDHPDIQVFFPETLPRITFEDIKNGTAIDKATASGSISSVGELSPKPADGGSVPQSDGTSSQRVSTASGSDASTSSEQIPSGGSSGTNDGSA